MLNRPLLNVRRLRLVVALACSLAAGTAGAQLRLPQVQLPQLPQVPLQDGLDANVVREPGRRLLQRVDVVDLRALRLNQIGDLLKRHRDALEADPRGEPVVRHEILAWSPSPAGIAAATSAGLIVINTGGDEAVTVLRVPDGADTAAMLERLRAADPDGVYDFNHIYTGSASAPETRAQAAPSEARSAAPAGKPGAVRVGLVDGGIARDHEVFRDAAIVPWGCDGASHPDPHGTAVAALMIGRSSRFKGAPGASLYAADIYCDSATGGSASRIAGALAWLAREQVPVVNISLVGPPNRILEQVVKRMVQRGHLLVAAVGNDGPAAPPLYPASYPGVVGVSGVDVKGRPLPEAARGPQVMFAAPGNQMVSAAIGAPPYRAVRGTSFASPIVAALLAGALDRPGVEAAGRALAAVAKTASGVAAGTISNETGHGVVGAAFRTDPSAFR
ncbi:S8 family serine peptidase [Burkholderia sp. LMU1-1-1.1]